MRPGELLAREASPVPISALDDLIGKVKDLVDNRIDRNLRKVANVQLVRLPSDESYTLEQFDTCMTIVCDIKRYVTKRTRDEFEFTATPQD